MPKPSFRHEWHTHSHVDHMFGDLLWHLFWGIVVGVMIISAIISKNYWLFITGLLALVVFFHPMFYEPVDVDVLITEEGIKVNDSFYHWENLAGFEIFYSAHRPYLFLIPKKRYSLGIQVPIDPEKVDLEKLKKDLNYFLDEYQNAVTFFDKIYRAFFP